MEFSAFIAGEGYAIIPISNEHQLQYACNVLNLGDSRIVSVHAPSARQIVRDPRFKGDVQVRVEDEGCGERGGERGGTRVGEAEAEVEGLGARWGGR